MNDSDSETKPVFIPRPFQPRPKLFAAMLLLFAAWVGFMIWMYVKTVYPERQHKASPPSSVKIAPAVDALKQGVAHQAGISPESRRHRSDIAPAR
jgi:hypothetical protein